CTRADAGQGTVALPHALQHGVGAAHYCLATLPPLGLTGRAGSGVEGYSGGVSSVCGHPLARLARRAGTARQGVSSVLPSVFRASKPRGAATRSCSKKNTATAPLVITAFWCSPRLGVSASAARARWREHLRRSRSAAKRTAGTSPSPVPRCPSTPCRRPAKR